MVGILVLPLALSATCCKLYRHGSSCVFENKNISITKGYAKDIISPLGCNSSVGGEGVLHVGPSSGASLYHGLYQMMTVRDGLGLRVGG
jgi:hypothetical protein